MQTTITKDTHKQKNNNITSPIPNNNEHNNNNNEEQKLKVSSIAVNITPEWKVLPKNSASTASE